MVGRGDILVDGDVTQAEGADSAGPRADVENLARGPGIDRRHLLHLAEDLRDAGADTGGRGHLRQAVEPLGERRVDPAGQAGPGVDDDVTGEMAVDGGVDRRG